MSRALRQQPRLWTTPMEGADMADRTCPHCGEVVRRPKKLTGPPATYCSDSCRTRAAAKRYYRAHRESIRAAEKAPSQARTCVWCQSWFVARQSNTMVCSKRCRMRKAAHARRLRDPDYNRRYDEANRERKRERMRAYREANPEKYVYAAYADANRESSQRRRARKKNPDGRVEKISYQMLADRDGWRCHLCGDPIDPAVAWPDPLSRSLDHVVPLSKGGEHVMPNCRLAHLGCNVDKGDRPMGEQLALI